MQAFEDARARWQSLIVGDVPNVANLTSNAGTCDAIGRNFSAPWTTS